MRQNYQNIINGYIEEEKKKLENKQKMATSKIDACMEDIVSSILKTANHEQNEN